MTDKSTMRERVWQQAFGRPPTEIDPVEPPDWLREGSAAFAVAVLSGPFAGSEVGDKLVEDLAEVVNALAMEGGDASLCAAIDQGLALLVEACLERLAPPSASVDAGRDHATASSAEAGRVDVIRGQQDSIRGLRAVLLRTMNGDLVHRPTRFPRWVQDLLLHNALAAVSADTDAVKQGRPVRAKRLSVMLAANFAAIRSRKYKAMFIDLLRQLCAASEEYMDPFLRDLVQIAHVAELGGVQ